MIQRIDAAAFCRMIDCAAGALDAQKQLINDLNVFPVPDGDTGTNMSLTLQAAQQDLLATGPASSLGKSVGQTATALLRGARGNSGVILSLLFRGMSKVLKEHQDADGSDFASALSEGVNAAYNSIMKPTEGTILTVSRVAAEQAAQAALEDPAAESVLEAALQAGREALAHTIDQNPVLKKAGVVDAGGKGFVVILEGMLAGLRGEAPEHTAPCPSRPAADFLSLGEEEITFTFDTVFIVRKMPGKPISSFRTWLEQIGDSLVIGEDDETFKVHVHTDMPGSALTEAMNYGTLELAKIENMRSQAQALARGQKAQSTDDLEAVEAELEQARAVEPEKDYGVVAVCAGEGLASLFLDLGADAIVQGGQTMNPSTNDILQAIEQVPARTVFVLPNNKNIIMAAQQTEALSDRQVVVVETKTVPQGVCALLELNPDAPVEDNRTAMTQAAGNVTTLCVTYAARPSEFDGHHITQGDYIALKESSLFATGPDLDVLLDQLADEVAALDLGCITLYYGQDVTPEAADAAADLFSARCPKAEVTVLSGGQPVYYYLISAE